MFGHRFLLRCGGKTFGGVHVPPILPRPARFSRQEPSADIPTRAEPPTWTNPSDRKRVGKLSHACPASEKALPTRRSEPASPMVSPPAAAAGPDHGRELPLQNS